MFILGSGFLDMLDGIRADFLYLRSCLFELITLSSSSTTVMSRGPITVFPPLTKSLVDSFAFFYYNFLFYNHED